MHAAHAGRILIKQRKEGVSRDTIVGGGASGDWCTRTHGLEGAEHSYEGSLEVVCSSLPASVED